MFTSSAGLKRTPSSVAGTDFEIWRLDAQLSPLGNDAPPFQEAQREVKEMCELIVPEEWRDLDYCPEIDKEGAAAFRKDVVSAASADSFRGPEDRDSRAVLGSFQTLLALSKAARERKDKNEATYRFSMNAMLADVFELQYLIDNKREFGDFSVKLKETIWLKDNPVVTNEAHPDVLVVHGPISASKIRTEFDRLSDERSTMPPPSLPSPTMLTATAATPTHLATLLSNIFYQYEASSDQYISLITLPMEHKSASKPHADRQLSMDFTTAHLQRRALSLEERPMLGLTLDDQGVSVYVSLWSKRSSKIILASVEPVHIFDFYVDPCLHVLQLFFFLRRLAKKLAKESAIDEEAISSNTSVIVSNLVNGTTVWRTFGFEALLKQTPLEDAHGGPPKAPGPSGPPHSRPPSTHGSDGPRESKFPKLTDTGNTSGSHSDTFTTQNLSSLDQDAAGEWDIKHWAAEVQSGCALSGEHAYTMDDLDPEEPCIDAEAAVPASKDAAETFVEKET